MACDKNELNNRIGAAARVAYFDESQGGKSSAIVYEGNYVWQDGSYRSMSQSDFGLGGVQMMCASWVNRKDPLEEQGVRDNLWFRIRYADQKLQDSIQEFEAAKSDLKKRTKDAELYGTPPPEGNLMYPEQQASLRYPYFHLSVSCNNVKTSLR